MSSPTPGIHRLRGIGLWFARNEQLVLSVLAAIIGVVVAYGAIGFLALITLLQELTFTTDLTFASILERIYLFSSSLPWWHVMLVPTVGGFLIGLFLKFVMPGGQAQGVAQVIEAGALRGGHIGMDRGLAAATVSAATLGFGASAGREGPMIHLGGAVASFVARHLRLSPQQSQTLLGCGVAAGIAASFNAPIAGVIFALEVVLRHYALSAFSPVVIAAVAGTVISRIYLGDFPAFIVPPFTVGSFWEFPAYVLLGFLAAGVAMLFMVTTMLTQDAAQRLPIPAWLHPTLGGLVVGAIAVFYPQVLGVGYETTDSLLQGNLAMVLMVTLVVAKLIATAVTLGSGFGGGVFSPSLFLGAAVGATFGGDDCSRGCIHHNPPIHRQIIFRMATRTHRYLTFRRPCTRAIEAATGARVARHDFHTVSESTSIESIRGLMKLEPGRTFFVTDQGSLIGVIAFSDLVQAALDPASAADLTARDIASPHPLFLAMNENLEKALSVLERVPEDDVPVVRDPQTLEVVGLVRHHDVLTVFNQALLDVQAEEHNER